MLRRRTRLGLLLLIAFAAGCATPGRLARQSEEALQAGDIRKAYEKARRALDKDDTNAEARVAFAAAATQLGDDYKARVLRLAEVDTIAAGRMALDHQNARAEFARYPVTLPGDPAYLDREVAILTGAARIRYREASQSLDEGRPKEATRCFEECARFRPGYRDVGRRILEAYNSALMTVAVLPFENQIEVRGLSRSLATRIADELGRRAGSPAYRFTRLLSPAELDERMTVAQSRGLSREQAIALGRRLGVGRVVNGRLSGLRASTHTDDAVHPIWHRTVERDPNGDEVERWERLELRVIDRQRVVDLTCTFEVLDVRSGLVVASRSLPAQAYARVMWSDYAARGDCDHYALVTPELRRADRKSADATVERWQKRYGGPTLPEFLEAVRDGRERRSRYRPNHRDEFHRDTRSRPVFLGELPSEEDLAWVALRDAWQPVLEALRELDPVD